MRWPLWAGCDAAQGRPKEARAILAEFHRHDHGPVRISHRLRQAAAGAGRISTKPSNTPNTPVLERRGLAGLHASRAAVRSGLGTTPAIWNCWPGWDLARASPDFWAGQSRRPVRELDVARSLTVKTLPCNGIRPLRRAAASAYFRIAARMSTVSVFRRYGGECRFPAKSRFAISRRRSAPEVQVALRACYWETLVDSHTRTGSAVHRRIRQSGLPDSGAGALLRGRAGAGEMQEAVWTRTLSTLDLDCLPGPESAVPPSAGCAGCDSIWSSSCSSIGATTTRRPTSWRGWSERGPPRW